MRLDRLELHGFKSFADKTTFEFTKDFTAIVGPNGSGKSNISDAIRWVLGEQSMKTLRGKSSGDVIFHGSEQMSKLGMAQVSLHIDNKDKKLPVEYEDVVITRKVFASGESEYRINNAKVRLQDILMMLAQAKFGQKSYAVIGQGMITSFLNASPQERKEFFDEATGVKEFQIKRDQAINKLIRTEENLIQAETLLTEIQPHLKSLERQVKRLEKREKVEAELRDVQVAYYGSTLNELGEEDKRLRGSLSEKEAQIKNFENDITEKQAASDAISQEASRGERYQVLQKQFNELLEKKGQLLKDQAVFKGKLEVEHERQGELSLVWLQRKEEEILSSLRSTEEELQVLASQMKQEQAALQRGEKSLKGITEEFRTEEYNVLKLRESIEQQSHAMTVPEIKASLNELFGEQEALLRELLDTNSLDEFKSVQSQAKKFAKQFAEFMDRLNADQKDTIEALRVEMKHKEQAVEKLVQERENIQHDVNELRVSIETNKSQMRMLENQVARANDELAQVQGNIAQSEKPDESKAKQAVEYNASLQQLEQKIDIIDHKIAGVREEIDAFNSAEEDKKTRLVAIQSELRGLQRKVNGIRSEANTLEVNMARVETRLEDVRAEVRREVPEELHSAIEKYSADGAVDRGGLEHKMGSLQRQLEAIGSVDDQTVAEYNETKERYDFLDEQTTDLNDSINSLEKVIDELDGTIRKQFKQNFKKINDGFQEYFKVLFGGGKAKLEMLTDEDKDEEAPEPGTEEAQGESLHEEKERELIGKKKKRQKVVSGIDIFAQPVGKKITNVTALSGGEKSMTSIALLCSIIAHNPSPFVFLDEVEAALDEENSEKLAAILKELAKKTQIIIITHNRVTMRAADILYGVTMGKEGKSHILSVELSEAEEMAEDEEPIATEEATANA